MNPIIWFESIMARLEDHFNVQNEISRLLEEASNERKTIMAKFDRLDAAIAAFEDAVANFTVPTVVDDSADVDARAEKVEKATAELKAKETPADASASAPVA